LSYAAVILAHRHPSQVARLAERLACPTWVHYDAKAPAEEHRRLARTPGLELVPRPVTVRWGHWSLVAATLKALAAVEGDPDHVLVLSGETYPIKPASAIAARLREPVSFIHHTPLPKATWTRGGLDRVQWAWIAPPRWLPVRGLVRIPWSRRSPKVELYGGSNWFVLHRDARNLVIDREATDDARRALRWAKLPEELFVQTVLANSPLRDQLVNKDLHYTDWAPAARSPEFLTDAHWDGLVAGRQLFARKFQADSPILDRIDRELL
jgi:hypothetical protein